MDKDYHMKFRRLLAALSISIITLLFLTSCMIRQDIYINADSSGTVSFDIEIEEFFTQVIEDFTVFVPEDESDITQLNIEQTQKALDESPYTSDAFINEIEENHWTGVFSFGSASELFNDVNDELALESLFDYSTENGVNSLKLYLDISTYPQLTELIPMLKDPSFSIFGPEENIGVSEEDYLDMISYLLGDEGPGAIERSYISIVIATDRPIKASTGGRRLSKTQIEFTIPIIDFLLLAEPIDYSVSW